jgi:hypothetical protein
LDKDAGDVHNNVSSESKFPENQFIEIHASFRGVNKFISHFPYLLDDLDKTCY